MCAKDSWQGSTLQAFFICILGCAAATESAPWPGFLQPGNVWSYREINNSQNWVQSCPAGTLYWHFENAKTIALDSIREYSDSTVAYFSVTDSLFNRSDGCGRNRYSDSVVHLQWTLSSVQSDSFPQIIISPSPYRPYSSPSTYFQETYPSGSACLDKLFFQDGQTLTGTCESFERTLGGHDSRGFESIKRYLIPSMGLGRIEMGYVGRNSGLPDDIANFSSMLTSFNGTPVSESPIPIFSRKGPGPLRGKPGQSPYRTGFRIGGRFVDLLGRFENK